MKEMCLVLLETEHKNGNGLTTEVKKYLRAMLPPRQYYLD